MNSRFEYSTESDRHYLARRELNSAELKRQYVRLTMTPLCSALLDQMVDQDRVIVTSKPIDGRMATRPERPRLWNRRMVIWNSVSLDVSQLASSPVESVFDPMRECDQPAHSRIEQTILNSTGLTLSNHS